MGNCLLQWLLQKQINYVIYVCYFSSTSKCLKTVKILFHCDYYHSFFFIFLFVWLFPLNKSVGSKYKFSLRNWCIFNCSITEHPSCTEEIKSTNLSVLWILVLKFQLIILKFMSHCLLLTAYRQNYFLNPYRFLYDRKNFPSSHPWHHTAPSNEASCDVVWTSVNSVSRRWQKQIVLQGKQWGLISQACKQDKVNFWKALFFLKYSSSTDIVWSFNQY